MGYYSEVAIAMKKKDFINLYEAAKNENSAAYLTLKNADIYAEDVYEVWDYKKHKNTGETIDIVIICWNCIKRHSTGMNEIYDHIVRTEGMYCYAGEDTGDVDNEFYGDIEWYDYIEAYSTINLKYDPERTKTSLEELICN